MHIGRRGTLAVVLTGIAALGVVGGSPVIASSTGDPSAVAAAKKKVPNVVGRSHQLAQDTLQDYGFYNLAEKDCTGRGRVLLWDRNWVVVRQTPRAGSRVSTNTKITLCSKKYSD
jgi:beta-lactam-binding protein with PASTA domain